MCVWECVCATYCTEFQTSSSATARTTWSILFRTWATFPMSPRKSSCYRMAVRSTVQFPIFSKREPSEGTWLTRCRMRKSKMRKGSGTNLGFKPHLHLGLAFRTHFNRVSSYSVPNVLVNCVVCCVVRRMNSHTYCVWWVGKRPELWRMAVYPKFRMLRYALACPRFWWRLLETRAERVQVIRDISRIRDSAKDRLCFFSNTKIECKQR